MNLTSGAVFLSRVVGFGMYGLNWAAQGRKPGDQNRTLLCKHCDLYRPLWGCVTSPLGLCGIPASHSEGCVTDTMETYNIINRSTRQGTNISTRQGNTKAFVKANTKALAKVETEALTEFRAA